MANIGYDAKRAFKNFTGLGNYSRALISGMNHIYPYNNYYLYTPNYKEKGDIFNFANKGNTHIIKPQGLYAKMPSSIWRSYGINKIAKENEIDIFHGLSGELPALSSNIKKVVTMHDVIFMRYPEYYKPLDRIIYAAKFKKACKDADKIIAISQQTADDIIKYLNADPNKIEIIYQGCDKIFHNPISEQDIERVKDKYNLPQKFILNVGTIEERKNLCTVIEALPYIPSDIQLIALGRNTDYIEKVNKAIKNAGVENRVRIINNANFKDFPAIYKQAIALTYVSVFEGFGIPVLEGITVGTPVITSCVSSMPEAGGDAALYVNSHNPAEIAEKINMIISSPTIVNQIREKSVIHAAKFKEEQIMNNINKLYLKLLKTI